MSRRDRPPPRAVVIRESYDHIDLDASTHTDPARDRPAYEVEVRDYFTQATEYQTPYETRLTLEALRSRVDDIADAYHRLFQQAYPFDRSYPYEAGMWRIPPERQPMAILHEREPHEPVEGGDVKKQSFEAHDKVWSEAHGFGQVLRVEVRPGAAEVVYTVVHAHKNYCCRYARPYPEGRPHYARHWAGTLYAAPPVTDTAHVDRYLEEVAAARGVLADYLDGSSDDHLARTIRSGRRVEQALKVLARRMARAGRLRGVVLDLLRGAGWIPREAYEIETIVLSRPGEEIRIYHLGMDTLSSRSAVSPWAGSVHLVIDIEDHLRQELIEYMRSLEWNPRGCVLHDYTLVDGMPPSETLKGGWPGRSRWPGRSMVEVVLYEGALSELIYTPSGSLDVRATVVRLRAYVRDLIARASS